MKRITKQNIDLNIFFKPFYVEKYSLKQKIVMGQSTDTTNDRTDNVIVTLNSCILISRK